MNQSSKFYSKEECGVFSYYAVKSLDNAKNGLVRLSPIEIFGEDAFGFDNISVRVKRYNELKAFWDEKKSQIARPTFENLVLEILKVKYQESFLLDLPMDVRTKILKTLRRDQDKMEEHLKRPLKPSEVFLKERYRDTPIGLVHEYLSDEGIIPDSSIPLPDYMEKVYGNLNQLSRRNWGKLEMSFIEHPRF